MVKRALTVNNIIKKKRNILQFEGDWHEAIGNPELRGSWLIWGGSGSGKTTCVMKLCKYLTRFEKVLYNSMEEGDSESIKMTFIRTGMEEVGSRLLLLDNESVEAMKERLRKKRSPKVVVLDSIQYSGMNYTDYKELRDEFPNHLFIIISHSDGKNPAGSTANRIRYDAYVKIRVEGYQAYCVSRYRTGEGKPYVVWEEGAKKYHGFIE